MLQCIVHRNTKELLLTLECEVKGEVKGGVYNNEYDSIGFFGNEKLEELVTEKDGKKYLNYEYCKEGEN